VFGLDVPLTQSQPTESTQGTHRTPSAPRQPARLTSHDPEHVDDSSPLRHYDTSIPGTRLEPRSDKENVTNIVIPINVNDEEDEITDEVFELRRRAKWKNVKESRISPIPSPTRSPRNISTLVSSDTEKL
ncbi:hypothetical protein Tco_0131490, partial [Tanacetum coccineum]